MPSMEQRVTVATAAMTPSAAYADPFVAHRAYAQTGQQEQGQSAAPQRVKVDIEFKPREAARFLKPRIDEETNRQGMSLVTGGGPTQNKIQRRKYNEVHCKNQRKNL